MIPTSHHAKNQFQVDCRLKHEKNKLEVYLDNFKINKDFLNRSHKALTQGKDDKLDYTEIKTSTYPNIPLGQREGKAQNRRKYLQYINPEKALNVNYIFKNPKHQ